MSRQITAHGRRAKVLCCLSLSFTFNHKTSWGMYQIESSPQKRLLKTQRQQIILSTLTLTLSVALIQPNHQPVRTVSKIILHDIVAGTLAYGRVARSRVEEWVCPRGISPSKSKVNRSPPPSSPSSFSSHQWSPLPPSPPLAFLPTISSCLPLIPLIPLPPCLFSKSYSSTLRFLILLYPSSSSLLPPYPLLYVHSSLSYHLTLDQFLLFLSFAPLFF